MELGGLSESQLIEIFIRLRNKRDADKRAFVEANKPTLTAMEAVNNELLSRLNDIGMDSISNDSGTAFRTERTSARVQDRSAFFDYVLENGKWELADLKANAPAVKAFMEENEALPPGVSLSREIRVNVRTK